MDSNLHQFLRDLHNVMRWVILIAGTSALYISYRGWFGKHRWTETARRTALFFSTALHLQLIVAIGLYSTSPLIETAWQDLGMAMGDRNQRFFSIEHPIQMILAILVATVGYGLAKRATSDSKSYRSAAIAFTITTILIAAAIPWPVSSHPRPLLPQLEWLQKGVVK